MEVLTESSLVLWSLQEGHEAASNQAMCTDLIGESGTILNIFPLMLQQGASSAAETNLASNWCFPFLSVYSAHVSQLLGI